MFFNIYMDPADLAHIKEQFKGNLKGAVDDYLDSHPGVIPIDIDPLISKALDYVNTDYSQNPEEYIDVQHQEEDYFREILYEALGDNFGLPEEYFE